MSPGAATEPGVVLGSVGYMAPEQVQGGWTTLHLEIAFVSLRDYQPFAELMKPKG